MSYSDYIPMKGIRINKSLKFNVKSSKLDIKYWLLLQYVIDTYFNSTLCDCCIDYNRLAYTRSLADALSVRLGEAQIDFDNIHDMPIEMYPSIYSIFNNTKYKI